ncbi:CAP domain-containing protein [Streptomyces sp. NPDC005899]|uniref:CAP domain-containing protein n=1 Tax=Streptomyces sp. NPDC005899 TaxID=3155716 RepID=UPI0033F5AB85
MGRHRRAGAAPAAERRAAVADGKGRGARRRKRGATPLRTGLLGVSAAVAVGAVAVASGLLPGGDTYSVSGGSAADQVRAGGGAPDLLTQGGSSADPTDGASASASGQAGRGTDRPAPPSTSASATPAGTPSATASKEAGRQTKAPSRTAKPTPSRTPERTKAPSVKPERSTSPAAKAPAAPRTSSAAPGGESSSPAAASAQEAVLALVNSERAKVGCRPVTASAPLTALAQNFSEDMAARDFFAHTDPDGASPWDRAAKAGVEGLGGENIARGQADAQAVMDAWMNSDGHRANILNCDYTTLGVGVHFGSGGPWWTQDFGF